MIKELIKKIFPDKKPALASAAKIFRINGQDIYWSNFDNRRVCGHSYRPIVGDGFSCKMESGKIALFKITEVNWCGDPSNMYFCTVEDVGYVQ